jgi:DNA topoisomerase IA
VDQLAEYSWSHFGYSPLITRGSAGRAQLVTLLLLYSLHLCVSWQSTLVTLQLLSTQHPCVSWQRTASHTFVTLHSSPVDQLAKHSWSHFCYSPFITRGSAGRAQLVTLLLLCTHHPWISWQSRAGHTSVTLQSSHVDRLAKHSWSHFCYSKLITRGSAGRAQLVTLLLLSSYHPWISWQSTAGHTAVTLQSTPVCQLAENSWSHFCYSPLNTRLSAGRVQLVKLLLLSNHHPWIGWQSTAGHTSVTLHSSPVDQLAE